MSVQELAATMDDELGLRAPWLVWPQFRHETLRLGVPLSLVYTPLRQVASPYRAPYGPVRCAGCTAILSPFTFVDYIAHTFTCPFCSLTQPLPTSYSHITADRRPAELHTAYQTIEYDIGGSQKQRREDVATFVFVVDICSSGPENFEKLRESLQWALDALPQQTRVALVTFGMVATVHELVFDVCPRKIVFRGTEDISPTMAEQYLGLKATAQKLLLPLAECHSTLTAIVEDLVPDPWTVQPNNRPHRCLGVALSLATSILQGLSPYQCGKRPTPGPSGPSGRILLLTNGPCTIGPGAVVDLDLAMHLRHWPDIEKRNEAAKHVRDAQRFYAGIGERATEAGISVHVFSCSVEQVGLFEMYGLTSVTGGHMMIAESYTYQAFTRSWRRFFEAFIETGDEPEEAEEGEEEDEPVPPMSFGASAIIELSVGPGVRIAGCIGHVRALPPSTHAGSGFGGNNSASVAATFGGVTEIGLGGTNRWYSAHLDSDSTLTFFLEVPEAKGGNTVALPSTNPIQFRTLYTDSLTGSLILRVTTYAFRAANPLSDWASVAAGFDQEAAAVVVAKLACYNTMRTLDVGEAIRTIDRSIIKLTQHFSTHQGTTESFQFLPVFEFFPQFLYHFRRSDFLQLFGQSPDETAMKRFQLIRQHVTNALTMIQPVLYAYTVAEPEPAPVFLDSSEATQDRILLFDSFFNLLVWTGSSVAAWREAGYHLKPEYANVAALLDAPQYEVDEVLEERFPAPRFDRADQGSSQARILLARVNPSTTYKTVRSTAVFGGEEAVGEVVATDDVSLQKFLAALKTNVIRLGAQN
ncbi:Sec23 [Giardia muris]|uniref:Protein transport protein SEC23 n=1 Tax=Giardia muris TaxID=5742 RepID=A0A4Z1SQ21_GIAMU|nr:Sec23 [Giardia muris]|eukprot:TNJ27906.1 Sec23 [Giardia muris]